MELIFPVFVLLTILISRDDALTVIFTIKPDYVYANTALNMTCRADESIVNTTATFYRQNTTIIGAVKYGINDCVSNTTWEYHCYPGDSLISLKYIPSVTPLSDEAYHCRFDVDIDIFAASEIVTVRKAVVANSVELTPSSLKYNITKGQTLTINCTAPTCWPLCSFKWTGPNTNRQGQNLEIQNIDVTHDGQYRCIATNIAGTVGSNSVEVTVQYGPTGTSLSPSDSQYTKKEGEGIGTITCSANCKPLCSYQWTFPDGQTLDGKHLSIAILEKSHHGTYSCKVQNGIGDVTISVNIIVNYKPGGVALSPTQTTYTIIEYRSLDISCSADCRPGCSYSWSGPTTSSNNQLQISNMRRNQRGTYRCTAANSIGSSQSQSVEVTVHTLPTKVQTITLKCIDATRAVITWLPDLTVVPGQNFTLHYKPKDGELQNTSFKEANDQQDIYVLHVDNLRPATEYIFTISSENYLGRMVSNEISCITSAGDITTDSPLNGTLIVGIVLISIAVLLITMVVIFIILQRCRKSQDETDGSNCTSFIQSCLSRIPGRKRKSANPYENTHQHNTYVNFAGNTGNQSENGLGNTEKQSNNFYEDLQRQTTSKTRQNPNAGNQKENGLRNTDKQTNNFYEELQTRNTSKTSKNPPKENAVTSSIDNEQQENRASFPYVNYGFNAQEKPKPPKKTAKIKKKKT